MLWIHISYFVAKKTVLNGSIYDFCSEKYSYDMRGGICFTDNQIKLVLAENKKKS